MTKQLVVFVTSLTVLFFIAGCAPQIRRPMQVESKIDEIQRTYGVNIHYIYDSQAFFPKEWLLAPISGKGSQIHLKEVKRLLPITEEFLSKYSKSILKKNLLDIYLLGELKFYGKSYGATNSKSALYVKSKGKSEGFTDSYLLGMMHHEFSSILLRNYKDEFPTDAWKAANQDGWKYFGTGESMLGQKDLFGQSEELLSRGFLVKYSQSSLEDDFNTFADLAFTEPNRLKELASKYERINKKYQLMIDFYKKIGATKYFPVLGNISCE